MTVEYLTGAGAGMSHATRGGAREALRYCRAAASPTQMAALERMNRDMDIRDILPTIRVPTLIMNRTGDPVAPIEAVRDMAARIPGARLVEFPGDTHRWSEDPEEEVIIDAIQEFVTGERPAPRIDRVLTTVLFTDIVGSTERAAEIGDAAWESCSASTTSVVRDSCPLPGVARSIRRATASSPRSTAPREPCAAHWRSGRAFASSAWRSARACTPARSSSPAKASAVSPSTSGLASARWPVPSEVLVSSTVKDLVAGSGIAFEDAGEHELKGVPDRWHLYRVMS